MAFSVRRRKKESPAFGRARNLLCCCGFSRATRRAWLIASRLALCAARFGFRRTAIVTTRLLLAATRTLALTLALTATTATAVAAATLLATVLNRLSFD